MLHRLTCTYIRQSPRATVSVAAQGSFAVAPPPPARRLCVVKGRKVPIGIEGVVIWMGDGQWGSRVGIKTPNDEVHWTATDNVVCVFAGIEEALA